MEIRVMSRRQAKRFTYSACNKNYAIISISDADDVENVFANNPRIKGICRLWFDDVETGEKNCITEKDAGKILSFVDRIVNCVDLIVVHCAAGISRSAGVAAALMLILNGDDSIIFDDGRYCPNRTCYRMVLNQYFGKESDDEETDKKFVKNIELWRKANGLD